jgi:hypothetical protein
MLLILIRQFLKDDEIVSNLSQIARLIIDYEKEINTIKFKLIDYGKTIQIF